MIKKNKKTAFITGGAGCIGLALVNYLAKKNYSVKLFDLPDQIEISKKFINNKVKLIPGSILDKSSMISCIDKKDIVIHLAASLGVRNTEENNYRCYQINVRGTENVLDICLQKGIKKFIYASSSEVYGEPLTNPISEDFKTYPKSIYAQTKLMGEGLVKSYNQIDKNFKYIIFRFFNTYGKNQVAQFVLPRFINAAKKNEPLVINGKGNQIRGYCNSSDVAKGIEKAFSNKIFNEIINLGNSQDLVTLKQLAKLVIKSSKSSSKIKFDKKFEDTDRESSREIFRRYCSTKKATKLLNFKPTIDLKSGITELVNSEIRDFWPE
jgi:UDP-glucose 4-epimerase